MKTQMLLAISLLHGVLHAQGPGAAAGLGGQSDLLGAQRLMGGPIGGPVTAPPPNANGFGLYSVTGSSTFINTPNAISTSLTGDYKLENQNQFYAGGSVSMGYAKTLGERTRFYVLYAPGFSVLPQQLDRSHMSHELNMNFSTSLSSRWDFHVAVFGSYAALEQYAFEAAQISQVSQVPGSLDDFLNGVLNGQYSNTQIASLLTGAPILDSPARSSIYGSLTLNTSATTSLSYRATPRLSLSFNGTGNRNQLVDRTGDSFAQPLVPVTTTASAGVTVSYQLTPRSTISANIQAQRTLSQISDANYYTGTGTYSRRVGQRWSVGATGGGGVQRFNRLAVANFQSGPNYIASGNVTFHATSYQAFTFSIGRTFVDNYGLGLRSTDTMSGYWNYSRPGRSLSASAGMSYNKSAQSDTQSVEGYSAYAGINRLIAAHQGIGVQGFYSRSSNDLTQLVVTPMAVVYNQAGVRFSYSWFPIVIEYDPR